MPHTRTLALALALAACGGGDKKNNNPPDAPMQPVDTADVAARIVECVEQRKPGVLEEIGGPEAQPFPHLAQDYLEARGLRRRVLRFRLSDARARRMGFAATSGHTGSLTWREWLGTHGD